MIHVHSLGRALQFYLGRAALVRDGWLLTFRELHTPARWGTSEVELTL
jgi:hypothetical protein